MQQEAASWATGRVKISSSKKTFGLVGLDRYPAGRVPAFMGE